MIKALMEFGDYGINPDTGEETMREVTLPAPPRVGDSVVIKCPFCEKDQWYVSEVRWIFHGKQGRHGEFVWIIVFLAEREEVEKQCENASGSQDSRA